MEERKPRVSYLDASKAGACQGCGDKDGMAFEINASNWITRFCKECLADINRQAKWMSK